MSAIVEGAGGYDLDHRVRSEQASAVGRNLSTNIPVDCILAAVVAFFASSKFGQTHVVAWLAVNSIINLYRYALWHSYRRGKTPTEGFLSRIVLSSLALGLTWSYVAFHFLNVEDGNFSSIICIICGISAGASLQGAPYQAMTAVFIGPMLSATTLRIVSFGGTAHYILAANAFIYLLLLLKFGNDAQNGFCRGSRLKHEAASLAVSLRDEHKISTDANARLHRVANHDSLTGLYNRAAFSAALDGSFNEAGDRSWQRITLFLIDCDHFKSINDTLGHKTGDDVLREVARRLRAGADPGDIVARLGGDEFAVLRITDTNVGDEAEAGERLVISTKGPFIVGGRSVTIGISLGLASVPDDCSTGDDLLARADLALYAAKDGGRCRCQRFDKSMIAAAKIMRDIEQDLPLAISDGSLQVWYQPQVSLADGALVGLEALIRWDHPQHGWISPPKIVAAALHTHRSHLLTGYVLESATARIRQLAEMGCGDVLVSINISPTELDHYDLPDLLRDMIESRGLDPRRLELEITEETFVSSDAAIATLKKLSAMGARLAIDDFGTGCSSISYFRHLRVNRIKIDQSFVTGFGARERDRILVQTMLGIGRSLNIEVIAEGVEAPEEAELLLSFGCPVAQGYLFAEALAPLALEAWMLRQVLRPSPCAAKAALTHVA